jgi:Mg-chelatase subunit ChlD
MAVVAACGLWFGAHVGAQAPSATPHPIPTTPPGAVATRPPGIWVDPPPAPAGCVAEVEPDDRPQGAVTLPAEFCVSGELMSERDQDLFFYRVAPEDGLVTWDVTVRGVPGAYTSIHFLPLASEVGVVPVELAPGGEVARVDSDVWIGMPPGTGGVRLAPGDYLLGISRGLPGYAQDLTDDLGYWVELRRGGTIAPSGDLEPNDTPDTATPVTGAFALSGDLEGTVDHYRWTLGPGDADLPWRLAVRSSLGLPVWVELDAADGTVTTYARADTGGVATIHDLALAPGEYDIQVPYADGPQPYELWAEQVTDAEIDGEPNDLPEQAAVIDPATLTATGRLTTSADVDQLLVDVDAALANGLVDVQLSWGDGMLHTLCVATGEGTRIACQDGLDEVTFRDLLIPQGRYLVTVSGEGDLDDRYQVSVRASDVASPVGEVEPNDDVATATHVNGAFAVGGDLSGGPDTFAWTLDDADAAGAWHLDLSGTPGLPAYFELLGPDGTWLAQGNLGTVGNARAWDLRLPPATYTITLTGQGAEPPRYVLSANPESSADLDPEPNDAIAQAVALDPVTLTARGRTPTRLDIDVYRFDVTEAMAATLTDVVLTWDSQALHQVCVGNQYGSQMQCAAGRDGVTLSNLALDAGPWSLQVSGDAAPVARYELRVMPGDPPTPDRETEPNDRDDAPDEWDASLVMHGTSWDGDLDTYRVHVDPGEPAIWRLDIAGRGVAAPVWRQPDGTRVGSIHVSDDATSAVIEDLYLVSGDHLLTVAGGDEYTLTLTRLGPPDLAVEREPNDDVGHAGALRMSAVRNGRLPAGGDVDIYRFTLAAPEHVVITAQPARDQDGNVPQGARLALEITSATTSLAQVPGPGADGATVFDGLLPQSDYEVWVRRGASESGLPDVGDVPYVIGIERADPFLDPATVAPAALDAALSLTTATSEVAAYIDDGQRVTGVLHIAPARGAPVALELEAATSQHGWWVELPGQVTVPSDGLDVPVVVHVPADAWRDVPVRITVHATGSDGGQGSAWTELVPRQDTQPLDRETWWPVPDALLGGLDAASLALGAQAVTEHFRGEEAHDGLIVAGTGLSTSFPNGPVVVDVDLAGDAPVPVAGTIIDPLGGAGTFGGRPRAFELLLSLDGVMYAPALTGELGPQTLEQAFVLPEPVDARFARLRVDSSWGGTEGPVEIGEWKVVARPGWAPSGGPIDLADPVRGAHIAWTDPGVQPAYEILGDTDPVRDIILDAGQDQQLVIGFADDRAAQVTGLRWDDPVGSDPAYRFETVGLFASIGSPLGPWTPLGTWELTRAADGSVAPFDLPEPVWARFIRLQAVGPADISDYRELPGKVRVLERPTDDTYRSILGQWGQGSARGIHEVLVPPPTGAPVEDVDAADVPEDATPLDAASAAAGRVARSVDIDWYELTVPAQDNTLAMRLATARPRDVRLRLWDADGTEVATTATPADGGVTFVALVRPGATYRVQLEQPILSVVFTFDTSASVEPWYPLIRAAVGAFAEGIRPGLEAVQVLPYGEHELLQGWSDQAYLVRSAIDAWVTQGGSSALEESLEHSAGMLEERDGARAVMAIGDAVGGGFLGGLPVDDLVRVQPVVFPVHIGGVDDPAVSVRIMQDLAIANGGSYQYASSLGEMERAFDRMSTWMRRPADYVLSYATSFEEYPPGSIEVVPAEGAKVRIGGVAVELILDTSGSMDQDLGPSKRIDVAKRSLSRLVEDALPEGLPVALRIFKAGSREKPSCATTIAVKLGPLDHAAMLKRIGRIRIGRGTRTPLAGAIEAARGDIGDVKGPRIVVLVTDGAETCKGDPRAAIQSLVEAGFDTTVNIVGFALDDPALKDEMASWAEAGGGVFFDAQDQAGLSAAIGATLRAPYRVYDEDGALVGEGLVGDPPLTVPMGTYRVEVLADPEVVVFEAIEITPGQGVRLTVGGG